jgi:hypothetical protein
MQASEFLPLLYYIGFFSDAPSPCDFRTHTCVEGRGNYRLREVIEIIFSIYFNWNDTCNSKRHVSYGKPQNLIKQRTV